MVADRVLADAASPMALLGVVPLAQPVRASVAEWIKAKRKENDLTLDEIGRQIGATKTTVQRYEAAKRPVMFDTMMQLADALRVSRSEATAVWVKANGGEVPPYVTPRAVEIAEAIDAMPKDLQENVKGIVLSLAGPYIIRIGIAGGPYNAAGDVVLASSDFNFRKAEIESEFGEEDRAHADQVGDVTVSANTDKN